MGRSTFADVLNSEGFDTGREYLNLKVLVYDYGFEDEIKAAFALMPFRGRSVDLDDFDERYGFSFYSCRAPTLDALLSFCEYVYNFARVLRDSGRDAEGSARWMCGHVESVVDGASHMFSCKDGLWVAVPKNAPSIAASEVAPSNVAADILNYHHRAHQGSLGEKARILADLAKELEPRRSALRSISRPVENDLFNWINNCNIRHNNVDPALPRRFNSEFEQSSDAEKERRYDQIHDLCCAAFLLLDCYKE